MGLINQTTAYQKRKALKNKLEDYFMGRLDVKIQIERRKAMQTFSLSATDYSRINIKSNEINRNVEIFNLKKDLAEKRVAELELIKKNIETALGILNEDEYQLLELSFTRENYTIRQIAANLSLAESTVCNKRRQVLNKMVDLLGMAS